ncbi:hypothetical protein CDAR_308301 [Caerostris darwini]|uniref:Uncharacterized protein n=1 Tax=Caerostris darwini TaxID=1538125 RepID=A0AAV4SBL5_9ARAC|nr:hypothetical protein CDAR_308301 [Caerostris darwini]
MSLLLHYTRTITVSITSYNFPHNIISTNDRTHHGRNLNNKFLETAAITSLTWVQNLIRQLTNLILNCKFLGWKPLAAAHKTDHWAYYCTFENALSGLRGLGLLLPNRDITTLLLIRVIASRVQLEMEFAESG